MKGCVSISVNIMSKENNISEYEIEEITNAINEVFEHFRRPILYEQEFNLFFKKWKRLSDEQIKDLFVKAHDLGLINVGVEVDAYGKAVIAIWRPGDLEEPSWKAVVKALKDELGLKKRR